MKLRNLFLILIVLFSSCLKEKNTVPLPEHPRPDFQRETWQNLNGTWQFKPDSANIGLTEKWQLNPEKFENKILVPFSWASPMSGIEMPGVDIGWYSRTFNLENLKEWQGNDLWVVFCASDFNTTLWINGNLVGQHSGGYVPFDFNISDFFIKGENQVVVRVEDEELQNRPSGKQYYGNAKGIWQTVYLEARPKHFIKTIRFIPDIDNQTVKAEVDFSGKMPTDAVFSIMGKNNPIFHEEKISKGNMSASITIPVFEMKLWELENPFLYNVTASLQFEDKSDKISSYFGMRKISAVKIPGQDFQYVALNNKPVYLKLALDQSYHPEGFYTFPSDKFMKEEIQRAKDIGLNGLRIHIKAEIPRKLYWADKLGLLIQEDIPNYWGEPDSVAKANWEYIAQKQVERDFNHPSIFSWVLFNETWGLFSNDTINGGRTYLPETQDWVRKWYHKTKQYDPTRLVEDNSPCNWDHVITDINTWHLYAPARHWSGFLDMAVENTYPGSEWNYIGGNKQGSEPMFNSECGAVWGYSGSTGDIDITWEYHIMMNEFRKRPKIAGFLFTEFHDVINEWNGYYRFDRSLKKFGLNDIMEGMTINDFHSDFYVVAGEDFYQEYPAGSEIQIPVGLSIASENIPDELKMKYLIFGWNELGDKVDFSKGEIEIDGEPFVIRQLYPIKFTAPENNMLMIFGTILEDGKGNVLHRNFVPFKITGGEKPEQMILTQSPAEYTGADWSIKHRSAQNGKKVWGMGSGYFEYVFNLPKELNAENIKDIEFRAEIASRYPQEKYLEEGDAERIGMTIVSQKGQIPGYGKNSYPQTDEIVHSSLVKIAANNQLLGQIELVDDPADHNGILSWMNQEPGWEWGSEDRSKEWLLDEAGSYGYLIKVLLNEKAKEAAYESKKVIVRMYVDEDFTNRGGLSIYGKESGKYPMDLILIFHRNPE